MSGDSKRKSFRHIADLIRKSRTNHPERISQFELSQRLGYKNGQFISNVERELCSIPLKSINKLALVLKVSKSEIKSALVRDYEQTIDNYIK